MDDHNSPARKLGIKSLGIKEKGLIEKFRVKFRNEYSIIRSKLK